MPIKYPGWGDWIRPAHIHFHVSKSSFHDVATQMFFPGDPLHKQDKVLQQLPPDKQYLVMSTQENSLATRENSLATREKNILVGVKQWKFDVVLRPSPT
jgi:protocatechuate 3,4-dioxygenase beta subunit